MRAQSLLVVLLILLVPVILFAGTTGKIKGTVTDKSTGEPLVGVNVVIVGTTLGGATNEKGEFYIINIPPGTYEIQVSYIGYAVQTMREVRIIADYTTPVNLDLSPQALMTGEVVVTAEQEIIRKDMTASASFHSKEEIINMPVNSFTEVMNTTAGFIVSNGGTDDGIHVRGGRTGEIGYYVDGFYMEDALYGGVGGDVARLGIQDMSIITGTFNAEYGSAMSGIVNIVTPEGQSKYSGQVRMGTDKLIDSFDWNSTRAEGSFSGPVPGFGRKLTFYFSGDARSTDTYLKESTFSHPNGTDYNMVQDTYNFRNRMTEKLVFKPVENTKIAIGGNHSRVDSKMYSGSFRAFPDAAGKVIDESNMVNFTWTQTVSKNTFFNVKSSYMKQSQFTGTHEGFDPRNWADLALITPNSSVLFNDALIAEFPNLAPFLDSNYEFSGPSATGFDDEGNALAYFYPTSSFYQQYTNTELNFMFDFTTQINPEHLIKFGAEYRQFEIDNFWVSGMNSRGAYDEYGNYRPEDEQPAWENRHGEIAEYVFKPKQASVYLQDKMEFENMIVNLGVRMDYLDTDAAGVENPKEVLNQSAYEDIDPAFEFSPRVGFGYPITDQAVLHFAYGHFIQFGEFQYLFRRANQNLDSPNLNQGYEPRLGNPSLKPERTTAYELGANWMVGDDIAVDVTVYYKDIYDFISTERIAMSPTAYTAIVNLDYGNSKGIEIEVDKRFSNHWAGRFAYTFSRSEGNADNWATHFNEIYTASVTGLVAPKSTNTLSWDQPHTINYTLDYRYPDNWGINLIGRFGSGLTYTPTDARGKYTGKRNSGRKPWTGQVDMRANKDFNLGGVKYQLWADVENLFNKTNINTVYQNSGLPDYSTNPNASALQQFRPNWYDMPRHVEFGMSIIF